MRARLLFAAIAACCPPAATAPKPVVMVPPAPVVVAPAFDPPLPALRLPRHFVATAYTARLAIDPAVATFDGEIAIEGDLAQRSAVIWLHGKHLEVAVATASKGATKVALHVTPHEDVLEVRPETPLDPGRWVIAMSYRGQIDPQGFAGAFMTKQGADPYVVTQFESTAARLVFPCLDEPDRKATWQLTLDVPAGLVAVSNTPITTATPLSGHQRVAFARTRPLPSYLVAFAVGPFEIVDAGKAKSGVPLRVVTPRGTTKKVAFLASSLPRIVDILEAWFEIPFPYPKLDVVIAPSLRGGAMENAGMITSDARAALWDKPSAHAQMSMISMFGHETSHQWFGDLVTAAWWDDIWLNESFATWIENKILAAYNPSWPSESPAHRVIAFSYDELTTTRKIRQPIENEGDIHNAFDPITYPKGAAVLRMLEHEIGDAKFRTAVHGYLVSHADGNATAADIFGALDVAAGRSLAPITSSFFDQAGIPDVAMTLACEAGVGKIALAQRRFTTSDDEKVPEQRWAVPVCIAYEGANHERVDTCTLLAEPTATVALDRCPAWFAPATTTSYFKTRLEPKVLETIRDAAWPKLSVTEHLAIYHDAYANARAGRIPIVLAISLATKLRTSTDASEIATGLGEWVGMGYGDSSGLPPGLDQFMTPELRRLAEARVRAFIEPRAKKFGLVAPTDADFATETIRNDTISAALWAHSHVFDAEARRLAPRYRELPEPSRRPVLLVAANADPELARSLRRDVVDEHDPELRGMMLGVLGSLDDPKRHRAMLDDLVPDPKLTSEDLVKVLVAGDQAQRANSEAYLRSHLDTVLHRMPSGENEDFPVALQLVFVFTNACDPVRRDELAAYVTAHFATTKTAARPVKQAIEGLDQCIARRKVLEPSLRAWLRAKS